jgi:lysyl-tRNA synthetase class 2
MSRIDETIQAKKDKRAQLKAKGIITHAYNFDKQHTITQCIKKQAEQDSSLVQTAGRLTSMRPHGKVVFADLQDTTGHIQLMLREEEVGVDNFEILSLIDTGDFIGVNGEITTTKTNEVTILVKKFTFLSKALRPLPSQWNAAEDKEVRFRKRYLDMLVNPQTKKTLDARWLIEKEIRRYLQDEHDFIEVETPIFQPLYGGTNAKPFTTHMNALDADFYLRLAPELYLKRLIVGGYDKVFEIARNFRNEGIDQTHQPEFTMIEWYEAYADYQRMMDVTEGLIKHLVQKVHGSTQLEVNENSIDVGQGWPRITMSQAIKTYLKIDFDKTDDKKVRDILQQNQIELTGDYNRGKAKFAIFDKLVPEYLIQPTWIIDYPREISPLAKAHRDHPKLAERFEGYIGGKEIADGWSEIIDPTDQRQIFENEQQSMRDGDEEAHPLDEDFLEAMEYGMPPLGGIGIGIDRLVMFITNTWSIKEVIAFPTLKPQPHHRLQRKTKKRPKPAQATQDKSESKETKLPPRSQSQALLEQYVTGEALRHHCQLVATAMEAYAQKFGEDTELWYQSGLLHDLDWEKYPEEHPNYAVNNLLDDYPDELKQAILTHAPDRTGVEPESKLERYLFACDELSGLIHAYSLMRPNGYQGMKASKVKKKLKDKAFAAGVSREDVAKGFELISQDPADHINFLITVFAQMNQ